MKNLLDRVREYIQRYQMIEQGDRIIAGVSGGADSVCLFFVLLELQKAIGFSFVSVHVNHGLRGADADADEQFVKELCEKYEVPLEIFRVDLESIAKKRKQSLEEAGRVVRREAFTEVMIKYAGNRIALAHHQNDNAETMLFNLARGTGLHGLGGIRPVNGVWIRPLLCLERHEIESYLQEKEYAYCTDLTNLETEYTRNKLRHQVFPILEKEVNSAAVRHMNETMEQMRKLQDFVRQETQKAAMACLEEEPEACTVAEAPWRELPELLQQEVIYYCLEKLTGSRKDLGRTHIEAVGELFDKQAGKMRNLPGNICAARVYGGVRLTKMKSESPGKSGDKDDTFPVREVQIPGVTFVPEMNLKITCTILERRDGWKVSEIPQKKYTKWFDYDIIKCLYVRTRVSGDRIAIDRAGHRQKLKSWFINEKISAEERNRILLLADGQEIVWVIGRRMSSAYQIGEETRRILQIEIEENFGG